MTEEKIHDLEQRVAAAAAKLEEAERRTEALWCRVYDKKVKKRDKDIRAYFREPDDLPCATWPPARYPPFDVWYKQQVGTGKK